jgi:uncharacterized protein (TIGR03435 family)
MATTILGRPVLDQTGLAGTYHVVMDIEATDTVEDARIARDSAGASANPAGAASTPSGNSVLMAAEKLGLRLEPRRAPVEQIVIDHVEKVPTDN